MNFEELAYGDCGYCHIREVQFSVMWSASALRSVNGQPRSWATLGCPRCGGVTLLEFTASSPQPVQPGQPVPGFAHISDLRRRPADKANEQAIAHVPDSISEYFHNSQVVLAAGVPSAAAVELRRTLEAAAAHFDAKGGTLVKQIEFLISRGLVTTQFGEALTHIRKIGNVGAHHTDEKLSSDDIALAARFTELLLRNLFEVPGELARLQDESNEQGATE